MQTPTDSENAMNRIQALSLRLVHGGKPPGIAPRNGFHPLLPPAEDWLSRLGQLARELPPRDGAPRLGAKRSLRRAG